MMTKGRALRSIPAWLTRRVAERHKVRRGTHARALTRRESPPVIESVRRVGTTARPHPHIGFTRAESKSTRVTSAVPRRRIRAFITSGRADEETGTIAGRREVYAKSLHIRYWFVSRLTTRFHPLRADVSVS
jgi:DNA-binding transcriptional regulator YhcF (GntR family)